ncbi:DUF4114 domain-containing protein [Aliamphritea spongicola]|uniref:DUF4114 domain-containing protein n=1 Tax=Aliamphritea spongicola TaxID=707589 RepID=UPI001FAF2A0B|nr:DUF4114 domain-containing protein [Aliamphritea spongicola]
MQTHTSIPFRTPGQRRYMMRLGTLHSLSQKFIVLSLFCSPLALAADDATDTLVNIDLPAGLLTEVTNALPEGQDVNQEFLNSSYNPNLTFNEEAHVSVTFLTEGAGYRNSLGYFTFEDNSFDNISFGSIDTNSSGNISLSELQNVSGVNAGMIFNNVSASGSGGSLNAGDTVTLGGAAITNVVGTDFEMTGGETFSEGTNMGFFLIQNAWNGSQVKGWDTGHDNLAMYTIDFLNPENSSDAYISTGIDEDARHVAMMSSLSATNDYILGFEDLKRPWGDNDFNDAVFRIRTDPVTAMFADIPSTETVISMQAAPMPKLGNSAASVLLILLAGIGLAVKQLSRGLVSRFSLIRS